MTEREHPGGRMLVLRVVGRVWCPRCGVGRGESCRSLSSLVPYGDRYVHEARRALVRPPLVRR